MSKHLQQPLKANIALILVLVLVVIPTLSGVALIA